MLVLVFNYENRMQQGLTQEIISVYFSLVKHRRFYPGPYPRRICIQPNPYHDDGQLFLCLQSEGC